MDTFQPATFSREYGQALDVPGLAREPHLQLQRYIEAQYPIRHPEVIAERQALLKRSGVIAQEPFIESMPGYTTGSAYHELPLSPLFRDALAEMASWPSPPIPPLLYQHQQQALQAFFTQERDLLVVTGTGSGKTETFLLPILLRCIAEAQERPRSFHLPGMRTLLLYPMNALVNDQLTRLRRVFGDPRWATLFGERYGVQRPVRFGMYTSRTPYPGLMNKKKHEQQLLPLLNHYLGLKNEQNVRENELRSHGRWPALDLVALRDAALDGKTHVGAQDYELYTRHQMQEWCPDILITNYSMLEYMLMRPIEQPIFQQTAQWLKDDSANTLLIVLDEAHLYNGVTGAEIALLLRRLQARLGITRERVRYILTSASLDTSDRGKNALLDFAATLVGEQARGRDGFEIIQGQRSDPQPAPPTEIENGLEAEAAALASFDLASFAGRAAEPEDGQSAIIAIAQQLHWPVPPASQEELATYLGQQLPELQAFRQLWKSTAGQAKGFRQLAQSLFPSLDKQKQGIATSALLSLSAAARLQDERPLLPVRAHLFFRGLPPLYVCINPHCSERQTGNGDAGVLGALWLSPRLHCKCGARVYELYAHRNCGALFLRVFAPAEPADFYWHEPGDRAESGNSSEAETLLLVGQPHPKTDSCESVYLHIMTGRVFSARKKMSDLISVEQHGEMLLVYRPDGEQRGGNRNKMAKTEESERHWGSCPVCRKLIRGNVITSLATKGEQPFVNLVRRQFELQPPQARFQEAAPNLGRKLLLFSDGRQRAARLARDLPREVELDTFRQALLLAVANRRSRTDKSLARMDISLYRDFVAVCTEHHLYFFDGPSQSALMRQMQEFHDDYALDILSAEEEEWNPDILQGYRLALLRQVADPFYSMQRMCAAVVEPSALIQLRRKPIFKRLEEQELRALAISWIEELLEESAFDARIAPEDRANTVHGGGFAYANAKWNDAEEAARDLLGYTQNELPLIRQAFLDGFCETAGDYAFLRPENLALRLTLVESWYQCQDCTRLIWLPLRGRCANPRCGSTRLIRLPGDDPSLRARTDFYREPLRQFITGKHIPMHLTAEEHTAQLSHRDSQQISATTEEYELRFQGIGVTNEKPAVDILSCTTTMEVGIDIGSLLGIGLRTMPPRRANYQQRAGRAGRRSATLATVLTYSENGSHDAHYFVHPEEMIAGALPSPQIPQINERLVRRHLQAALIQTFFHEQIERTGKLSKRQYSYLAEALGTTENFFATNEPSSLANFERWLEDAFSEEHQWLLPQVMAWLPNNLANLSQSQKREFVHDVARDFVAHLCQLARQLFPNDVTTGVKRQNSEAKTKETQLLDLLFEHGFLPTYAFPRTVRNFVIEKRNPEDNRVGIEQRPQQSVDIALSEYAPGRELIVNKATYRVGGIYVDPFQRASLANPVSLLFQESRDLFALCIQCGYARHKQEEGGEKESRCPLCQGPLERREILDPPGFAPERGRPLEQRDIRNDGSSRSGTVMQVKLVLPQSSADNFSRTTADGRVAWSEAEHRELLIVNSGKQHDGFAICQSCGAASSGDPEWLHKSHQRPFLLPYGASVASRCSASEGVWRGFLGHVFHSDLLLLRFQWPIGVAYDPGQPWMHDAFETLTQALLLAATRLLDISTTELQAGWSYTIAISQDTSLENRQPVVYFFLFDALSGGAGYATQVGQHINELLTEVQRILDECPDRCERSCYRCLRNYHNRLLHHRLDRYLAGKLLRAIIDGKAPETLPVALQATQLEMLCHYLELTGNVECRREAFWQGIKIPLLLETKHGKRAIGVYPVQQDRQVVRHLLDNIPQHQVRVFSDYQLAHELPRVAEKSLEME